MPPTSMPSTAPPLTYPSTRDESPIHLNSSSPAQQYYSEPSPTRPPTAIVKHKRNNESVGHPSTHTYVKTSVSSATSGGSAGSGLKNLAPLQSYTVASQAEQGLMEDVRSHRSHNAPSGSHRHSPSSVTRHEMVEDSSAVIRYIKQKELEGPEPEESDHALWILVSHAVYLAMSLFSPCTVLAQFSRPASQPFQLCVLDRCHDRPFDHLTFEPIPQRVVTQHLAHQERRTHLQASFAEDVRSIYQPRAHIRF